MTTELTFDCMVCGEERPDERISVAYRPAPGLENQFRPDNPGTGTRVNVRYCNDRSACAVVAHGGPWWTGQPDHRVR